MDFDFDFDNEMIDERKAKCIECVRIVPVFKIEDLQPGDHVVFRNVNYDHHGIISSINDDGFFEIIEATNTSVGASSGLSSSLIPPSSKSKAKIQTNKREFQKGNIALVHYKKRIEKTRTVERAKHYAEQMYSFKYHLFSNNCEHFATYCVTGHRFSVQVTKFMLSFKLLIGKGFNGLGNEKERNKELYEQHLVCHDCYHDNDYLMNAKVIPIKSKGNVNEGDIIRYSYYRLMHDAVVLQKKSSPSKSNVVILAIAHYAFCGFRQHRTIKEETIEFSLDGSCNKLDYSFCDYPLYSPSLVVERARSRIGEQFFVFFSNDSSHFARWCQLQTVLEITYPTV